MKTAKKTFISYANFFIKNLISLLYKSIIFLMFFLLVKCAPSENSKDKLASTQNTKSSDSSDIIFDRDTISNETSIRVQGKSVVFFMPAEEEIEEFLKMNQYAKWEFVSIFNSFRNTAQSTVRELNRVGISAKFTTAHYFEIAMDTGGVIKFDRIIQDQMMGHIISDGLQEPLINFGLYKNKELQEIVKTYFGISDFSNRELDSLEQLQENIEKYQDSIIQSEEKEIDQ